MSDWVGHPQTLIVLFLHSSDKLHTRSASLACFFHIRGLSHYSARQSVRACNAFDKIRLLRIGDDEQIAYANQTLQHVLFCLHHFDFRKRNEVMEVINPNK